MPDHTKDDAALRRVTSRLRQVVKSTGGPADFATVVGCSRQSVYNWTSGDYHPDLASIIRISKELELDANWLLGLS